MVVVLSCPEDTHSLKSCASLSIPYMRPGVRVSCSSFCLTLNRGPSHLVSRTVHLFSPSRFLHPGCRLSSPVPCLDAVRRRLGAQELAWGRVCVSTPSPFSRVLGSHKDPLTALSPSCPKTLSQPSCHLHLLDSESWQRLLLFCPFGLTLCCFQWT